MKPTTIVFAAALLIMSSSGVAAAAPDEREACATAAEQAQQHRDEGRYRKAQDELVLCARNVCPAAIRKDCGRWLSDIERDAPTIVLGAKDARGQDVVDADVSIDGEPLVTRLDGKPVTVDSGEHVFTFRFRDGSVTEKKLVLRAAEKSRPLVVTLEAANHSDAPTPRTSQKPNLVLPIALAGVGAVALGSFAVFGISGQSGYDDLKSCRPFCNGDDVDSVGTKFLVADISLGIGIAALAAATYFYLTRREPTPALSASSYRGFGGSF